MNNYIPVKNTKRIKMLFKKFGLESQGFFMPDNFNIKDNLVLEEAIDAVALLIISEIVEDENVKFLINNIHSLESFDDEFSIRRIKKNIDFVEFDFGYIIGEKIKDNLTLLYFYKTSDLIIYSIEIDTDFLNDLWFSIMTVVKNDKPLEGKEYLYEASLYKMLTLFIEIQEININLEYEFQRIKEYLIT